MHHTKPINSKVLLPAGDTFTLEGERYLVGSPIPYGCAGCVGDIAEGDALCEALPRCHHGVIFTQVKGE